MKFLEKIGLQKKKKEEEEVVAVAEPKQSAISKIGSIMSALNKPMGGGMGFTQTTPQRSPRERQLGIPEYVNPRERARDFSTTPKPIPKAKKVITNWRPTPGKVSRKGEEVKW